jgi:hypothetical protein
MKWGEDVGKKYRKRLLGFDPLSEKYDKYGTILLLITFCYIGGHLLYHFW